MRIDRTRTQHPTHPGRLPGEIFLVCSGVAGGEVMRGEKTVLAYTLPAQLVAESQAAGKTGMERFSHAEAMLEELYADLFKRRDAVVAPLAEELLALDSAKAQLTRMSQAAYQER